MGEFDFIWLQNSPRGIGAFYHLERIQGKSSPSSKLGTLRVSEDMCLASKEVVIFFLDFIYLLPRMLKCILLIARGLLIAHINIGV